MQTAVDDYQSEPVMPDVQNRTWQKPKNITEKQTKVHIPHKLFFELWCLSALLVWWTNPSESQTHILGY